METKAMEARQRERKALSDASDGYEKLIELVPETLDDVLTLLVAANEHAQGFVLKDGSMSPAAERVSQAIETAIFATVRQNLPQTAAAVRDLVREGEIIA